MNLEAQMFKIEEEKQFADGDSRMITELRT
jgi:hypothetical protein